MPFFLGRSVVHWDDIIDPPPLVNTFNGRSGDVLPAAGDYSPTLVGFSAYPLVPGTDVEHDAFANLTGSAANNQLAGPLVGSITGAHGIIVTNPANGVGVAALDLSQVPESVLVSDNSGALMDVLNADTSTTTLDQAKLTGPLLTGLTAGTNVSVTGNPALGLGSPTISVPRFPWADLTGVPALVDSFNGRSGDVAPAAGDYTFAELGGSAANGQLAGPLLRGLTAGTNVAVTGNPANGVGSPTVSVPTFPWGDLTGVPALVESFNGRSGAVAPASGDYSWSQVASKPSTFPPSPHTHGVGDLHKATGSAAVSGGNPIAFPVQQYAFASPLVNMGINGTARRWFWAGHYTYIGDGGVTEAFITWDYLTSSGNPRIWASVAPDGSIDMLWEAEDPADEEFPDEAPFEVDVASGLSVVRLQIPDRSIIREVQALLSKAAMPAWVAGSRYSACACAEVLCKDLANGSFKDRWLEIPDDILDVYSGISDDAKRMWYFQLWLRAASRTLLGHRAVSLIPLYKKLLNADRTTGGLSLK